MFPFGWSAIAGRPPYTPGGMTFDLERVTEKYQVTFALAVVILIRPNWTAGCAGDRLEPPSASLEHAKEEDCSSGHGISSDGCVESSVGEDLTCGMGASVEGATGGKCMRKIVFLLAFAMAAMAAVPRIQGQQRGTGLSQEVAAKRVATEKELESVAVIERKLLVPMRDGKRMAADVYRPKDTSKKYPVIFVRTPYNFNYWDVRNGVPRDMSAELDAVKRGYAYVEMNERGHFFSEGEYDILGPPRTDGFDALAWMASQPWSNGKVGTIGCSSTAEWQLGVAALGNPALAAMVPQGFGAGVGRVRPYFEQGNWYRGGAVQMLFIAWLYGQQNQVRPLFPANTSQEDLIRASKSFDLAQHLPPVDWSKELWHLPVQDIIKNVDGPRGIFESAMPVETGGRMIQRAPNDPAWYRGGLYHDDQKLNVPGLWFMSWYDVSAGPNLALYNHVRKTAPPEIANEQWAIIAPVAHCAYNRATADTIVGERSMGDARLDYNEIVYGFFDRFLKGEKSTRVDSLPKV